ncbi:uncharacterized protein BYT42DRAFT_573575 [Radiomyces spectabilis]|uniref:uncharacterized protein n=1 Tax=Radiomyces spectabilis TaxID=64574 RepID=UPI00221FC7D6|nr:uncharacterized protein BYT42DRAFT_573575 [Radiomyces spectabilis]KAI8376145.1 hypothetical protein BYT42DRAFT_573575 [Radiomyces spectabilis]
MMDPFLLYALRQAMNSSVSEPCQLSSFSTEMETVCQIFGDTISDTASDDHPCVPLTKAEILSLVYHADMQWVDAVRMLKQTDTKINLDHTIHCIHQQQRIYLDTLHLLQKALGFEPMRLRETVLFASQSLRAGHRIRHLESTARDVIDHARRLCEALETSRGMLRRLAVLSHRLTDHKSNTIRTSLLHLLAQWKAFEELLYQRYVQRVFGHLQLSHDVVSPIGYDRDSVSLPREMFCDAFTSLLPTVLDRALAVRLLSASDVQDFDPKIFIALPRLAVLAGVTWLAHRSGWRGSSLHKHLAWFPGRRDDFHALVRHVDRLEDDTIRSSISTSQRYRYLSIVSGLERALVSPSSRDSSDHSSEQPIFILICALADSILSNAHNARPLNMILKHLFHSRIHHINTDSVQPAPHSVHFQSSCCQV